MGDVDALRPQFARHGLRQSPQSEFGACERCVSDSAAQPSGRSGKENCAFSARYHDPSRLAPGKKSRPACHLPHLAKYPVRRLQNGELNIRPNIENANLEGRIRLGLRQEGGNLLRDSSIECSPERRAAESFDLGDQRRKFVPVSPSGEHCKPLRREFPSDCGADIVTGSDYRDRCIPVRHVSLTSRKVYRSVVSISRRRSKLKGESGMVADWAA